MPRTHIQPSQHICDVPDQRFVRAGLAGLPRFLATTAFSFWLTIEPSQGQARDIAFGALRKMAVPRDVDRGRMAYDQKTNALNTVVWTARKEAFFYAVMDSTLASLSFRELSSPTPLDEVYVADFTNDRKNDFLFVDKIQKMIHVASDLRSESPKTLSTATLPFEPDDVIVGDFNNDKRLDLIFIDLKNQGIMNYPGDGRGGFTQGRIIAPDNAVSKVALTHLNNDHIIDLVFFDWVKSELHLLYGIGRGRFLDQSVFPVEGDLRDLLVLEKGKEGFVDLVLVMKKPQEIQLWEGNGLGDFRKQGSVAYTEELLDVVLGDVNNDQLPDLIALHRGILEVFLNSADGAFKERISYSCPESAAALFVLDVNGDKRTEALLLGKDGTMTVLLNGNQPQELKDSLEFASGLLPSAVWAGNADLDNFPDVALVNEGSGTLSLFAGTAHGLLGQTSFPVSASPRYLVHHSKTDTTSRFVISYPESQSLSFFSLNLIDNSSANAVIPSDGESEALYTRVNDKGQVEFFCSNAALSTKNASFSYYLRIGPQTFLERSYSLASPDALLGVSVAAVANASHLDLMYVFRTTERSVLDVGVAVLDSVLEVKEQLVSRELALLPDRKSYLWSADLDADDTLDLIVSFPQESKSVYVLRGGLMDSFGEPQLVSTHVSFNNRHQVRVIDLDGDGLPDLIVNNQAEGAVGWLKNKGGMTFEPWETLVSSEAVSQFDVFDINRDGLNDMAITFPGAGTLKIFSGKVILKDHGTRKASQ